MLDWKHLLSPTDKVQPQQHASSQAKQPACAVCVRAYVVLARRPHSCTPINLDMISGGDYHMIPSVIESSSYLTRLDLIGKETCDSTSGAHSEALLTHPNLYIRRIVPQEISPSLIFFLCSWVEMNVTMQAGRVEEVIWDVSSALKRDDGILSQEAWRLGFLTP